MALPGRDGQTPVHLRDYLRVLGKHRWLITAVFLVTVATGALWTHWQTPIYQAATTLLIEPEPPKVLNIQEITTVSANTLVEYYRTQYALIQSAPVIQLTADALRRGERTAALAALVPAAGRAGAAGMLSVEPVRNTQLVLVRFEHPDPAVAAEVSTAVAHAYVRYNLEVKLKGAREALAWLNDQLATLRAKVEQSSVALQNYRVRTGLLGLEEQRRLTAQKIAEATKAHLDAQAQRLSAEARLAELGRILKDRAGIDAVLTGVDDPLIRKLKTELAELQVQRSRLLQTYKEKHPEVLKADAQLEQLTQRLDAELARLMRALETDHKVARAREDTLLGNVHRLRREGQDLSEKEIPYLALQREAESNQQLYEAVLKRVKETNILTGGLDTNNVRIVQEAVAPAVPVRPRRALAIVLSVMLGLAAGIGLAVTLEYFDTSLKSPADVEQALGLPVVAVVPSVEEARARKAPAAAGRGLVSQVAPNSAAAEAFRTLRTNIQFASLDRPIHHLVITSAQPDEGKTTTAANFAVIAAEGGARVCLVEADLRRPAAHSLFGMKNDRGVTTALIEGLSLAKVAQPTRIPNLAVVASGPLPAVHGELVGSRRMRDLLEGATADFDLVLWDTPPVLPVADAVALAALADGVVLVVRAGVTAAHAARYAVEQIEAVKGRVIGVALNRVDVRRDAYYHYSASYSSYYDGGHRSRQRE